MPFGIPRFMGWCGHEAMSRAVDCQVKPFREIHEEWAKFFGEDEEQVRAAASFGNIPLVVLSRDPGRLWISSISGAMTAEVEKEFNQGHEALQEQLPRLLHRQSGIGEELRA